MKLSEEISGGICQGCVRSVSGVRRLSGFETSPPDPLSSKLERGNKSRRR